MKRTQKQWDALELNGLLSAAFPFVEFQVLSDSPGSGVTQSCRLLRLMFSVNWSFSQTATFGAAPPLPFFWVGVYNTNTQTGAGLVNVVPTVAGVDTDKPWMFRRAWPIQVMPDGTGSGTVPAGPGPWLGSECWEDWPIHGGRGTSALEHDRAIRVVVGIGPALITGATLVAFTLNGMMLCELG